MSVRSIRANLWRAQRQRPALILVIVLIVIAMLSLAGFTFAEIMFTEHKAARLAGRELQAKALAESGAALVEAMLDEPAELRSERGGLYDNPDELAAVAVETPGADSSTYGRFSVVSYEPSVDETGRVRYGLENESARLNLKKLLEWDQAEPGHAQAALVRLPGMTPELADALLDSIDADDAPREFGAESEYYAELEPPQRPANRAPQSLEELLAVRDVTRTLLLGLDRNRNGRLEPFESFDATDSPAAALATSVTVLGWSEYLTLDSAEGNLNPAGQPKIDLNDADLARLHARLATELDEDWAAFVVAYRQNGPAVGTSSPRRASDAEVDLTRPAKHSFASVLDLIGKRTMLRAPGSAPSSVQSTVLDSPLAADSPKLATELPRLFDLATVATSPRIEGRVNVNLASREVLLAVPGIDETLADEILTKRKSLYDPASPGDLRHAAWLVTEGLVTLDEFRALEPNVTGGGDVYRAQIVGFFDETGPASRAEAVFDATSRPTRLISWKDLKHLGRGYTLTELGAAAGQQPAVSGR